MIEVDVISTALHWVEQGHRVALVTLLETWGSAPRPVGALLVVRDDGLVAGSVSGGCVEEDLIARLQLEPPTQPTPIVYGVSSEEARRFGLPCGGRLKVLVEPFQEWPRWQWLVHCLQQGQLVARCQPLSGGPAEWRLAGPDESTTCDETHLTQILGPRWRLLIIGAGQASLYLAKMATMLDYQVTVCDPREEYRAGWDLANTRLLTDMPDDVVVALRPDGRTAIVALTHDPRLDDLALLEALKSNAFYVGALGSRAHQAKRRERLALFDLTTEQIGRLRGPVGLALGSRTPPEIAITILAELIGLRSGVLR